MLEDLLDGIGTKGKHVNLAAFAKQLREEAVVSELSVHSRRVHVEVSISEVVDVKNC